MRNLIAALTLVAACGDSGKSSPAERRDVAIDTMGGVWPEAHLSTEGDGSRTLVVGAARCNMAILYTLYGDGVRNYLRQYSFTGFRCARGEAEMTSPWK